jgi:hypothetical protein
MIFAELSLVFAFLEAAADHVSDASSDFGCTRGDGSSFGRGRSMSVVDALGTRCIEEPAVLGFWRQRGRGD